MRAGTLQNDMTSCRTSDDVLTMLVHLGYLGFDERTSEVFVPNREVLRAFENATTTDEWAGAFRELEESKKIVRATWDADAERVAELLELAHDRADNRSYNSEESLRYAVLDAYYAARIYYTVIPELGSGKGYADVAFLPSPDHPEAPALVVELKWNSDARTALDQIRDRDYPQRLAHYEGEDAPRRHRLRPGRKARRRRLQASQLHHRAGVTRASSTPAPQVATARKPEGARPWAAGLRPRVVLTRGDRPLGGGLERAGMSGHEVVHGG